jgi:hypothetical protein
MFRTNIVGRLIDVVVSLQSKIYINLKWRALHFTLLFLDEMIVETDSLQVACLYTNTAAVGVCYYKKWFKWPCFGF